MAAELGQDTRNAAASRLQDLVLDRADTEEFLHELVAVSASMLSARGNALFCSMTVARNKRPLTVVGSDTKALVLEELQYEFRDGPCPTAMRTRTGVHVPDVRGEVRWPEYMAAVSVHGIGSILGLPLPLEGAARAVLHLYSPQKDGFTREAIIRAEAFAEEAAKTLRMGLRLAHMSEANNDMVEAMKSRTVIDVAVGAIMAQNRCSQDAALQLLIKASSTRNIKLRDVAASVIASVADNSPVRTHFDE